MIDKSAVFLIFMVFKEVILRNLGERVGLENYLGRDISKDSLKRCLYPQLDAAGISSLVHSM